MWRENYYMYVLEELQTWRNTQEAEEAPLLRV